MVGILDIAGILDITDILCIDAMAGMFFFIN